jgi:hypothetical protein
MAAALWMSSLRDPFMPEPRTAEVSAPIPLQAIPPPWDLTLGWEDQVGIPLMPEMHPPWPEIPAPLDPMSFAFFYSMQQMKQQEAMQQLKELEGMQLKQHAAAMQVHTQQQKPKKPKQNHKNQSGQQKQWQTLSATQTTTAGTSTTGSDAKSEVNNGASQETIDTAVERPKAETDDYRFLYDWSLEFDKAHNPERIAPDSPARPKGLPPTHPMMQRRDVTTLMVKNLPNRVRVEQLIEKLNEIGFAGRCDYVYMPMDWQTHANKGFGFANFATPQDALEFATLVEGNGLFTGYSGSGKRVTTCPASRQGVVENLRSVSYTCRKDKVNFPWVLRSGALVGMRPADALECLKRKDDA